MDYISRKDTTFGDIIIAVPLSPLLLSSITTLITVIIGIFLFCGHYSRKQTVQGYIVPNKGLIKVYAPERGIVVKRHVEAEQTVNKGDVLFVVSTRRSSQETVDVASSLIADAKKARKTLLNQIEQARKLEVTQIAQIKSSATNFKRELATVEKQIATEKRRLTLFRENLDRLKPLLKSHLIAPSDYQKQYEQVLAQQSTAQALERSALGLERQIDGAASEIAITQLNTVNQIAEYQKDLAELDQQLTQYQAGRDFVIRASGDGTVASVVAKVGQQVEPNAPLMTLLPKGSVLTARLLVPTSAIGFLRNNEQVLFRYAAFPYQRFGLYRGHVTQISKAIFAPGDLPGPVAVQQPVYLVTAALDSQTVRAYGKSVPLQAGMLFSADIVIDRESLIHWILDPLYSVTGRL